MQAGQSLLCIFYFKQRQPRMCGQRAQNLTVLKQSFDLTLSNVSTFPTEVHILQGSYTYFEFFHTTFS